MLPGFSESWPPPVLRFHTLQVARAGLPVFVVLKVKMVETKIQSLVCYVCARLLSLRACLPASLSPSCSEFCCFNLYAPFPQLAYLYCTDVPRCNMMMAFLIVGSLAKRASRV